MLRGSLSMSGLVVLVCLSLIGSAPPEYTDHWTLMPVPGTWDEHSQGKLADYDGFAWYRCQIAVPQNWEGSQLTLDVEQVDNAHEAYFNGVKLGGAGAFPPNYKNGLSTPRQYKVPAEHVRAGQYNLVALRVYDNEGRGGFKGRAPALVNDNRAISLQGKWQFRVGDDLKWAEPISKPAQPLAMFSRLAATASLASVEQTQGLSPHEAAQQFTVPDDLRIEQVLAEPIVRQPLHISFDERGRMWVVQYIQYPYPAGLTMVSRDKFWRSVYDKVPPAPPNHFRGADKITIHEDTNGDGVYDKHKTFVDGLSIVTACAKGRGGVWVLNPPYLLFYPDKDNDDVPDGDPEVHLSGFNMEDTHSVVNSLRWGPDGWLYASQGSTVSANVIRPGVDKQGQFSMGQLIWRYHPETRQYEIFAEGGGNAFGVEIDSKGRIYSGHNGGNTRGFHYVQGGYYQKGFTKHGPLSNPYSFGYFSWMQHHDVPRFTHNFVIYEGGSLPMQYRERLFGVEPLQGRVVMSEIQPDRSSFKTTDLGHPVTTTDRFFRPVEIKVGPDGGIYVADWYEDKIAHGQHFEGQVNKDDGRIYRLQKEGAKPAERFDLGQKTTEELIDVLKHENKWFRQEALRLIGDRKDRSVIPLLKQQLAEHTDQFALECLWALNLSGGLDEPTALGLLDHEDSYVRQWTVRLLCDQRKVSRPIAQALAALAAREPYVHVRSQLASSAKRLDAKYALPVIQNLLGRAEDVEDIHVPLLLWWALESTIDSGHELVLALFKDEAVWRMPLVEQHILNRLMRRYAMAGTRKDLLACAQLFERSPSPEHTKQLMQGFEQAFQGRSLAGLPAELVQALAKSGGGSIVLGIRQGKSEAVAQALQTIADEQAQQAERLQYVQTFGEVNEPKSVPVLLQLLRQAKDEELQMAALTSLQRYSDESIASDVLKLYQSLKPDVRSVAETLLAGRKAWAKQFLEAVDAGRIGRNDIPLDVVRKMTIHNDDRIGELVKKHWSDIEGASSSEMQRQIAELTEWLQAGSGEPSKGKQLYNQSCGKCHRLFGEGGMIGPDLTTYKRDDTLNMLIHIVNPSAEIREGFETYIILTEDGRAVSGFLVDQDNRVVVVRGQDGQTVTIDREQIEEMLPQRKSLMPEGLLKDLSEQDVRDLFAYLRSSQPLN
jgi:putative heme-binding domain-containing protein